MAEPSGPVNGQNRVVEGLVTTGGVAGLKKGGNAAAVTGSAYQALDTIVGGAGTAGTPAPDVVTVQGIASGTVVPVSGTVTTSPPANASTNLTQVGGAAVALGAAISASSIPVALSTDGTVIGPTNETAPATDTAVSGLNGRLQRIAQRLTSIIGLLPTALGIGGGFKVEGSQADFSATEPNPVVVAGWDSNNSRTRSFTALGDTLGNGDPAVNFAGLNPLVVATVPYIRGGTPLNNALFQQRGNVDYTLLASAARTVTTDTADQTNYNGRGAHIVVDVTAVSGTTPTLVITVQGKDSASGKYYTILQSAVLTAIGTYVFRVYPGETVTANQSASDVLPRTWRVDCAIGGTTPSFTFSVGASNII